MIRSLGESGSPGPDLARDVVLVVNDLDHVADELRRRYPEWEVRTSDTYLSAITTLGERRVRAVVACVEESMEDRLDGAVAGLREAAGERTRLVLCCRAASEAAVAKMTESESESGADDYIVLPLRGDDLDEALCYAREASWRPLGGGGDDSPVDAAEELSALGCVVRRLFSPPSEMLHAAAELVRSAMGAVGASVVVQGTVATAGKKVSEPVLTKAIRRSGASVGQISVGPRSEGSYTHADSEKLRHLAPLVGDLIVTAGECLRWRELALTDTVSELPNRRYLLSFLGELLDRCREDRGSVTLLLFDIDDFKTYNDEYGHEAGDEIIHGCGELFRRHCREHDVVTRFGGDEFAVVFWDSDGPRVPGSHHPRQVLPVIERFRESLRNHSFSKLRSAEEAGLTISGGLASFPWDATTVDELIVKADEALFRAKRDGKNRIFLGVECAVPSPQSDEAAENAKSEE